MATPVEVRPIITNTDIVRGYVTRYFAKSVPSRKIYEVTKEQFNIFAKDPYYTVIELPWIIVDKDAITKNNKIIEHYNKKMSGINRKLRNPNEYVQT